MRDDPPFSPKATVQDRLRQDIIRGVFQPGTRITESALAQKYGVSRIPVREALKTLEAEGFVTTLANVGCTVAAIPVADADDLFAVREALEIATASRAANRAAALFLADSPPKEWWQTRRRIASVLQRGDLAVAHNSLEDLPELNNEFHYGIAVLSGSATLAVLLHQLSRKIEWLYASDEHSRGKKLWSEHRTILAAIDAGDAQGAVELMGGHVRQARLGFLQRFGPEALPLTPNRANPTTGHGRSAGISGHAR